MKNVFLVILAFATTIAYGQYSTGGTGIALNFADLTEATDQVQVVNGNYQLNGEITVSANDTLQVETNDTVFFATDGLLRIEGVMLANPAEYAVFTAVDTLLGYEGITFDESNGSSIENIHFMHSGGLKLLYSDATIKKCTFYKATAANGSGAINMLQSSPVIDSCDFILNARSGVASSATALSSPTITNSYFYRNNTENGNRPQINLGTSDGVKDIIIQRNTIDGFYNNTGGISLATLAGGSVSAVVEHNLITNNRYGMNIQGNVNSTITHNRIIDNNLEENPMNGGSGISFYSGAEAIVAHNTITGNLWGISIPTSASPNLGQLGADTVNIGHNYIYDNGNGGTVYNLYNNTAGEIYAQNNYWGTTSTEEAAEGIVDVADNASLGEVFYEPIYVLSNENQLVSFSIIMDESSYTAEIDHEAGEVQLELPEGTDLSALTPHFEASLYAHVYVNEQIQESGITMHDFTESVLYTVIAEDSTATEYSVNITTEVGLEAFNATQRSVYPNPTSGMLKIDGELPESIVVLDMAGRIILSQTLNNEGTIDVSALKSGVYFLQMQFDNTTIHVERFIKTE
ncbi:MAG: T9SS type A sorting domain-containing protein [Salinivirgaceae bacterium]